MGWPFSLSTSSEVMSSRNPPSQGADWGNQCRQWDGIAIVVADRAWRQCARGEQLGDYNRCASSQSKCSGPLQGPWLSVSIDRQGPRQDVAHDKAADKSAQVRRIVDALVSSRVHERVC